MKSNSPKMEHLLPQRVKALREKEQLSQVALAAELELSPGLIASIEIGTSSVSINTLLLLAHYFEVSTDYLLGLTDI